MRGILRILIPLMILALLPGLATATHAQTPAGQESFETGFIVRGIFLEQYNSIPNPLDIYGLPISNEFRYITPSGITTVQYFTKARFDLVNGPGGDEIVVASLGSVLYPGPGPQAPVPTDSPACRQFASTGKSVCYAFLQFYNANSGADHFGNPISDLEIREGRYVQYFEKVRMEWQPERDADSHVVLTDLGKRHYDLMVGQIDPLNGLDSAIVGQPRQPKAHAFVARALIPARSQQTLYIVVYDLFRKPVADAQVWVTMVQPDGERVPYNAGNTNANGISVLTFQVGDWQPQQVVELEVRIEAAGEVSLAQSWFRIWY